MKCLLTQQQFTEALNFIQERQTNEIAICKLMQKEFEETSFYPYGKYETKYIELLKIIMNDQSDIIDYFIYELNFGKDWKMGCITDQNGKDIKLNTSEDLYNYLNK